MNYAVILAGGVGKRTGESIPKQFIRVNNKPLIVYTLEKFQNCNLIDEISIACIPDWMDELRTIVREFNLNKVKYITEGGNNGLTSAYNGVMAINSLSDNDLVLIHDGVRPFVDEETIVRNIDVASKHGLAMTAVDCLETLVYSEDSEYSNRIIPRDNLKRILTPQTFKSSILKELYKNEDIYSSNQPSTFALYMSKGLPIYLSRGNEKNIKITYPEDVLYFKSFFKDN